VSAVCHDVWWDFFYSPLVLGLPGGLRAHTSTVHGEQQRQRDADRIQVSDFAVVIQGHEFPFRVILFVVTVRFEEAALWRIPKWEPYSQTPWRTQTAASEANGEKTISCLEWEKREMCCSETCEIQVIHSIANHSLVACLFFRKAIILTVHIWEPAEEKPFRKASFIINRTQ